MAAMQSSSRCALCPTASGGRSLKQSAALGPSGRAPLPVSRATARVPAERRGLLSVLRQERRDFAGAGAASLLGLGVGTRASGVRGLQGRPRSRSGVATYASAIDEVLVDPGYPPKWPFRASDFARMDESSDFVFYSQPRIVTHIDDPAIGAITKYYAEVFPESGQDDVALLDICSSWISHYPKGYTAGRISGLGMNADELERNQVLTDFEVVDLNFDPKLPYDDNTFDVVTNAVSVDYLNKPLEVFKEMHRVLKPGGQAIMSFSNRCFPTKAISIWNQTGDGDHVWIVGAYFHYTDGFTKPKGIDISPNPGLSDPMYVVTAKKMPPPRKPDFTSLGL